VPASSPFYQGPGRRRQRELLLALSVGKKVKNIAQGAAVGPVNFGVGTPCTGYRGKFLVLDVKYFGKESPGGPEFIQLECPVTAFRAFIV
jgi:hypothetical protein